jgi:hypothetical protein
MKHTEQQGSTQNILKDNGHKLTQTEVLNNNQSSKHFQETL